MLETVAAPEDHVEDIRADLEAVGLVVRTEGQWQAVIELWWAAKSTADWLDAETGPYVALRWADDMLYELALAMGAGLDAEVGGRATTPAEIGAAVADLGPWIPWVVALVDDLSDAEADIREIRFGAPPSQVDNHQTALGGGGLRRLSAHAENHPRERSGRR